MGEWKKVKLGDCIEEVVEKTTENNQHQVLSVTKDGIFSQEEFFKKQIASENNIGYKVIRKNNLVFSTMNLWMGSLDVLTNYDIGIVSPAYKIFIFNEELMLPSYGNYFMKSYYMLEQYKNCSEQGASIVRRNLDLKALLNTNINIPLIAEQEKIVRILEKVDLIIKNYERLLEEKNRFIKSQFVEMFGSVKKFEMLGDICSIKARIGWQGLTRKEYLEEGNYRLVTGIDFLGNTIDFDNCYYVSKERYQQDENIQLKVNDVLVTKDGTIGKVAFIDKLEMPATLNSGVFVIRDKSNRLNPIYLEYALLSDDFSKFIKKIKTGSTVAHLNQEVFLKFKIPVPEKSEQDKFEPIVKLIDKQKFELKRIIENYKSLKKGLMQQLLTGKVDVNV